jgi:hypothetical protein
MSPRHEAAVDTNAHDCRDGPIDYGNASAMTCNSCALDSIQKPREANLGLSIYTMRTQPLPFYALRRRDARRLVVRTGVTLVSRRVRLNYLDIWEQGLDRSQNVN